MTHVLGRILSTRVAALLGVATVTVLSGSGPQHRFNEHQKAYYADKSLIAFVRPGLEVKMLSAEVGSDRGVRTRFRMTDPKGLPLDLDGIDSPGSIRTLLVIGYIPPDSDQYVPYTTRTVTSSLTNVTAVQPYYDANGRFVKLGDGTYDYFSGMKLPENYDRNATHTVALRATRDLSEFGLGNSYANAVINFVPAGGEVKRLRDVVRTEACNQCHDPLQMHGGNRSTSMCIVCHTKGMKDPDTGESINFAVMIHRIHRGQDLPSVKAGKPFRIIGSRPDQIYDFSTVAFPRDIRNCETCHRDPATQKDAWLKPNRAACGSCHDDVNFETGEGHNNLPQLSDNLCANCHTPQGELEFDASIIGAHKEPRFSRDLPGTRFEILDVADGVAGKRPTVTFSIKDAAGNPILPSQMSSLGIILAGPTSEYSTYVREDAVRAQGSADGRYYWTFESPVPASARGSYSVGIEGYRNVTLLPGTKKERVVRDAGINKTHYFSVDGSPVAPRRTIVSIDKCNSCHFKLEMHGSSRNQTQHCVQCHNPNQTDAARRPPAEMPAETISFRTMIHRIHTGEHLTIPYSIWGRSRAYDFTEVRFPGDRRNCEKCHVGGSEQVPLKEDLLPTVNKRGMVDPMQPIASACMGCHTGRPTASHVVAMTTDVGESCAVCHGRNAEFSINRMHAR